jgi:hypothetical protein
MQASDPDSPPSGITYSLVTPIPQGATINGTSGLITWPTSEATGPSTNIFTVRATENNAQALTDTRSFSVIVNEVNEAPTITPVVDIMAADGELVSVQLSARDNDVPTQTLSYQVRPGAPAGATVSSSGLFSWQVPVDQTASTNTITVRVTDNGPGSLFVETTFRVIVQPLVRVAINEVMYAPSAANGEYIELINAGGVTWNISGWRLTGRGGLSYTFPNGTTIAPGGFLNVARSTTAFQAAYGAGLPMVGNWTGNLQSGGDTLTLIQPTAEGDVEIDKLTFGVSQPWPAVATGTALQLVDARQDNNRVANWEASTGYSGPTNLVVFTNLWRYNQTGTDLGTAWRGSGYSDGAWPEGAGLLYVENSPLPEPKSTLLTLGPTTFYFRTKFTMPVKPQSAQLSLRYVIDDGAVFYLNGTEIHRIGMAAGEPTAATFADRTVSEATYEGPVILPADLLVAGDNVLAVEVHQINAGSSDVVFGCELNLVGGQVPGRTPGAANSVAASLPAFDPIFVNEVLPVNTTGLTDSAGDREPWVELYNSGTKTVSLEGLYLTDSYANLTRWGFPAGTTLAAGEYRIIWLDAEPGESIGSELHANFRLNASGGIALVRMQNEEAAVVDYINFNTASANVSIGASPNGQVDDRMAMTPTPAAPNMSTQPNREPQIQGIGAQTVAEGTQLQVNIVATDPDAGQTLSYSMQGAPAGASLSAGGVFTWTPTEAQAPMSSTVTIIVADNGTPVLRATNTFQLTATEVNQNPVVQAIGQQNINEGSLLTVTVTATDADLPAQPLTYALTNAPAGMTISSGGAITWTPTEAQGPGSYDVGVIVRDNVNPAGTATVTFNVLVAEVNTAPVLGAIADQTVNVGTQLAFTATATDADLPAQSLTFTLEPGAPSGAAITAGGAFTWTPTEAQGGTTNTITVRVRDGHSTPASHTRSFVVVVQDGADAPQIAASISEQGECVVSWNSEAGVRYRISYQDVLQPTGAWQPLIEIDGTGAALNHTDTSSSGVARRFYRVEILP